MHQDQLKAFFKKTYLDTEKACNYAIRIVKVLNIEIFIWGSYSFDYNYQKNQHIILKVYIYLKKKQ